MLLEGIYPALTTPFYPDGRLNPLKLAANVARMSLTAVSGMVVLGSTGEAPLLTLAEQGAVLREAAEAAAPEKVMIAGVGQESARATLDMLDSAALSHYDAALVRTPSYYRNQMRPIEMLAYYRLIADKSPLPVLLYSVPANTNYSLPVELIGELSAHPNIIGIKDSAGDAARIGAIVQATRNVARDVVVTTTFAAVTGRMLSASRADGKFVSAESLTAGGVATLAPAVSTLKTRTKKTGFAVLAGSAQSLLASLDAGASGAVLALAAAAPQACHEVYAAQRERDAALAGEKQDRLLAAAQTVVQKYGVPGVKFAAELNGYFGGYPRSPLLPLTAEEKDEIAVAMAGLRS